jgi:hypothetical protein
VSAPRENGSNLAPQDLLSHHSDVYGAGMAIRVRQSAWGCQTLAGPSWQDSPPPGTAPWFPVPAIPATPTTPLIPPGNWQRWDCSPQGSKCKCTVKGRFQDSTPPPAGPKFVDVQILCSFCNQTSAGDCATPTPAIPTTPVPAPPATPAVPVPFPSCECKYQYLY